jgi:hypothetical protein
VASSFTTEKVSVVVVTHSAGNKLFTDPDFTLKSPDETGDDAGGKQSSDEEDLEVGLSNNVRS